MEAEPKDLGAVAVDGNVKYEVLEHDAARVKLRNIAEPDQYVLIDLDALTGLASVFKRLAVGFDVNR